MTAELARRLLADYGPLPDVGAVDGTEDDYGDLLCDVFDTLGGKDYDDLWNHFQDVATCSRATTYDGWLAELEAVVAIYSKGAV